MKDTKIIVVTDYENAASATDGKCLTEKIEEALQGYPSTVWTVRSVATAIHTSGEGDLRPDTTYATTIILDRIVK